jgi:hypothetical protein
VFGKFLKKEVYMMKVPNTDMLVADSKKFDTGPIPLLEKLISF